MALTKHIVTELQSLGLRLEESILKRKGGAGPAEGGTIVVAGRAISVPTESPYVGRSPYELKNMDGAFWILTVCIPPWIATKHPASLPDRCAPGCRLCMFLQ